MPPSAFIHNLGNRFNDMALSPKHKAYSKPRFVIAIDFGTTFTGVAYADDRLRKNAANLEPEQIRDIVSTIKDWPKSRGHHYMEKVPSVMAYDIDTGEPVAWGWGATDKSHKVQISYFKLGLQYDASQHYTSNTDLRSLSTLGGFLTDPSWKHPALPEKGAFDFTVDYLKELRTYILKNLEKRYTKRVLSTQEIKYVVTVPAIWTDKTRSLTKKAAVHAGFPEDDLDIVTEPEAAALYSATLCHDVDLTDGDRFLVCDAGGGTVV